MNCSGTAESSLFDLATTVEAPRRRMTRPLSQSVDLKFTGSVELFVVEAKTYDWRGEKSASLPTGRLLDTRA